jgi:hypothetical protein
MLLDALLRHLALKLTRRALSVNVCELVFIDARSCLFQEAPLAAAMDWRFPLGQTPGISQYKGGPIVLTTRVGKVKHSGETEAEKVVTPLVCSSSVRSSN